MTADAGSRRLVAILAADVVGYSRMIAADETATLNRLRVVRREIIEPLAAENGGRIFKTTGDGLLAEFPSTVQALRCAIAVQQRLRDGDLQLRIGVHQGDVVVDGDDLLGDGVNVAARLEALAEPGDICISGRVHEDALGKVALSADDLGDKALKNIDRPIRVYRVRQLDTEPAYVPLALPDMPSLAVLPFQNMGGDPEQEYFADGMVEEIITALARIRWLFVIARNSSFAYKGKSPDVRQVGRELGVRYVLEGSVRKSGNRIRLIGQLIDSANGAHIWADRFDGTLENVFELQDQMTASVVAAIEPKLRAAEIERARRKPVGNPQAYDLMLRALPSFYTRTRDGLEAGVRLLRKAIEIDPTYAPAFAHLARFRWALVAQGWMSRDDPTVTDVTELAHRAVALGGDDPEVLRVASFVIGVAGGDLSSGIALASKSITLNPNSAAAFVEAGFLYAYAGDTRTAIAHLERALRLDPLGQAPLLNFGFALAHFVSGNHEAVVEWTGKALQAQPNRAPALRYRAASLGLLGRVEEGRQVVQRLLEQVPDYTITRARRYIEFDRNNIFKTPGVADSFYEGLRRSGMPE